MGRIPFPTIDTFSETCLEASAPEDITDALTALLHRHGVFSWFVGSLAFVSSNGSAGFGFHSMPLAWLNRYLEANHFDHDPVFQHALRSRRKLTWKACREEAVRSEAKNCSLAVFDEAAEFDLTEGLIMPIRGLGDLPGAVTYGGHDLDLSADAQMSLFLVGAYAYEGYRRLVEGFKPLPPFLTDQELEVLRWSAEGKSASVIGTILTLSPHTVRDHQKKIRGKYQVGNIIQAAVFAVVDGNLKLAGSRH
jgi:LuxR family quorum sensing-dependent transcriptional regulator